MEPGKKSRYMPALVAAAILGVLVVFWFTGVLATVKPIHSGESSSASPGAGASFDKVKYVDSIWTSRVIPTVEAKSADLGTVLTAIDANPDQACKTYGNNVGGAWGFLVSFSGKVRSADIETPVGTITADVAVEKKERPVKVAIGPIILGSALRDALAFMAFNQFYSEIQYAQVSDELNTRVTREVTSGLNGKVVVGKRITVKGAFTYDQVNGGELVVTPVILKLE
ncbi:MAG: DUF2291 domain-containing protein [Spirochaetia bacterium]|jgi:predicted lipoprotein